MMAAPRSGLSSWLLPKGLYDFFWPSTHTLGVPPSPPTPKPDDHTPLSTNPMENLKADLWKYAEIFREQKKSVSETREKLMLLFKQFGKRDRVLMLPGIPPSSMSAK